MARICVVEDDETIRALLVLQLRKDGHDVAEAHDGAVGLERITADRPHLVVTDLLMPVMSGDEMITELRTREDELARLPVVVLTALSQTDERVRALDARNTCVLHKPHEINSVRDVVAQMLRERYREDDDPELIAV